MSSMSKDASDFTAFVTVLTLPCFIPTLRSWYTINVKDISIIL